MLFDIISIDDRVWDMKNNKGQALIEFIFILPLLIVIITVIIDFLGIMSLKYSLQNDLDNIYIMYKDGDTSKINNYISANNININYKIEDEFTKIELSKKAKLTSFILKGIMNDYYIKVDRTIINE